MIGVESLKRADSDGGPLFITTYAQTNLQLFAQMRRAGYSDEDLAALRRAYDLAVHLFTSKYRGSGKPLLAHLVGTASVLASLHARVPLLAAAVLHAAYIFGDFGDARGGAAPAKRDRIRAAVGPEVEDIIARYDALQWDSHSIPAIRASVADMSTADREVLLLRLANELEDHLDLGVLYCGNAEQRREAIRTSLQACDDLAHQLRQPQLAFEFDRVFREVLSDSLPEVLRQPHDYTHDVRPSSSMLRPSVMARLLIGRYPRLKRMLGR
jgi:(p)ppGpp synthase/HD superfamily hydrolase